MTERRSAAEALQMAVRAWGGCCAGSGTGGGGGRAPGVEAGASALLFSLFFVEPTYVRKWKISSSL